MLLMACRFRIAAIVTATAATTTTSTTTTTTTNNNNNNNNNFGAESFVFQFAIQQFKNQNIYRIINLSVVLYGCETWSLT